MIELGRLIDRVTAPIAPRWTLKRQRARAVGELLASYYDIEGQSRRTQGWRRASGDANAAVGAGQRDARMHAHDLVRNNAWAASMVETIVNQTVGWAITTEPEDERAATRWRPWAETTACDADGRNDFAGLEKLVMRTTAVDGECLVRRRWRRPSDGLPIPMQLQVLEPDYLDRSKEGVLPDGGRIIQGVEFDVLGRRRNYWMFREHPGATTLGALTGASVPIPASEILHIFRADRPGQVRGISWFAPVTLRLKDFDEYEDAALLKQKIAACLAVITTDATGESTPGMGVVTPGQSADQPDIDMIEPGSILHAKVGRSITVVEPPTVSEHDAYAKTVLRAIATGGGITYEDLTGDFSEVSFSSSRMSRLRGWRNVENWRWHLLIPQFCEPAFLWAMQAAAIIDEITVPPMDYERWTAPPLPMIEPDREGLAYQRLIRSKLMSHSEVLRERGYRPKRTFQEMADDDKELDRLGIISDADPRYTTQGGQLQGKATAPSTPATTKTENDAEPAGSGVQR